MHRKNFEFAFTAQIRKVRQVIGEFRAQHIEVTASAVSAEDPKCCAKGWVLAVSNRDPPRVIFTRHYLKARTVLRVADYFPTTLYPNSAVCHGHLT